MAEVTYQISLATDGTHAVTVTTTDPVAARGALEWAKGAYEQIISVEGMSEPPADRTDDPLDVSLKTRETPICAIHHVPMVKQGGRFGSFWSCHQRQEDGSWCTYRPEGD